MLYHSVSLLRRWHLCQNARILYSIFGEGGEGGIFPRSTCTTNGTISQETFLWEIWLFLIEEDGVAPTNWPFARVTQVYPGQDGLVRVATIKTSKGPYKRPVSSPFYYLKLTA